MVWKKLPEVSDAEYTRIHEEFGRKARFLVDENLEGQTIELLRAQHWNVKSVCELGLSGHEDEEVLAAAWREDRILLTNDRDFLDNICFPEHSNPGIIVLPDAKFESTEFAKALRIVLEIFAPLREAYRKSKIVVSGDGGVTITNRDLATGAVKTTRYKIDRHGDIFIWVESTKAKRKA